MGNAKENNRKDSPCKLTRKRSNDFSVQVEEQGITIGDVERVLKQKQKEGNKQ